MSQKLENLFYRFLWGKTHKIPKSVVIAKFENGGLNLTDISEKHYALKTSWIKMFVERNNTTDILNLYLASIGLELNSP